MRTPALLAEALGRPEDRPRRGAYGMTIPDGLCGAYVADEGGEWWCRRNLGHLGGHRPTADPKPDLIVDGPPLWIRRTPGGNWMWQVERARGDVIDSGHCPTWAQALALGLAALETAHVRSKR